MKQVTILQLNDESQSVSVRYKKFASIDLLKRMGLEIDLEEYKVVWSGNMDIENAEDVYMKLQGRKPEGYTGHSLSVSDIVIIDGTTLYCDSYGFVDITFSKYGEVA